MGLIADLPGGSVGMDTMTSSLPELPVIQLSSYAGRGTE